MKKLTFVLMLAAVMLFTAAPLFAEGMMFGIKGGLNMSNLTGDDATIGDTAPSMKMGFGGGIFFNYAFTELFAVQVEGLYMMKGATYEWSEGEESGSVDVKIDYIEVPLLLKVTIPTEGKIKPAIFAGPTFGFLMSAKGPGEDGKEVDIKDEVESMDIGIIGGAEIGYKLEKGMIFLSASYEVGMQTIGKVEEGEEGDAPDFKNTNIGIYLGYGFPL
jgi:hypothetical protein